MQPNARFHPTLSEPLFLFPSLRVRAWLWRRQRDKLSANINSTVRRRAVVNNNTEKLRWPAVRQPWRRDSGRRSGCHLRLFEAAADTLCPPLFHLLLRPPLHSRPLVKSDLLRSARQSPGRRLHVCALPATPLTPSLSFRHVPASYRIMLITRGLACSHVRRRLLRHTTGVGLSCESSLKCQKDRIIIGEFNNHFWKNKDFSPPPLDLQSFRDASSCLWDWCNVLSLSPTFTICT